MSDINYGPFPRLLNEEEIYLLHLNHCIFPYPERIILLARRPDEPDWMMIKVPG